MDRNIGEAEDLAQSAKNAESQTEVSYLESNFLQKVTQERDDLKERVESLESTLKKRVLGHEQIMENDKLTRFYTGFPTYAVFSAFVTYLEPKATRMVAWSGKRTGDVSVAHRGPKPWKNISIQDQLLAVLVRLRLAVPSLDICERMGISEAAYSRLFATWITFLAAELKLLFPFPSRQQIDDWMPRCFQRRYPNTRIIIDCYEVQCQRLSGLLNQSRTFRDYKSRNTFKVLIGCTPSGYVSFVSDVFGGCISDKDITIRSGLLDLLGRGDMIMADRVFDMQEAAAARGILVNVPPKLGSKKKQMLAGDMEKTRCIAELLIHIERCIGRGRRFEILHRVFSLSMYDLVSDLNTVCMYLTNFDVPLVDH